MKDFLITLFITVAIAAAYHYGRTRALREADVNVDIVKDLRATNRDLCARLIAYGTRCQACSGGLSEYMKAAKIYELARNIVPNGFSKN